MLIVLNRKLFAFKFTIYNVVFPIDWSNDVFAVDMMTQLFYNIS